MRRNSVEKRLSAALEHACPPLDLSAYPPHHPAAPQRARRRARHPAWRVAMAGALCLALTFAGGWGWQNLAVGAVLFLDVNPSVELSLNRADRVVRAQALNPEAQALMADMDLRGVDAQVAVNALVGAMVQGGYLAGSGNTVLISVESADPDVAERLRSTVAASAGSQLLQSQVQSAVVSQVCPMDPALDTLSQTYDTSQGKAALIQALIADNPSLTFDQLSALSLSQLSLLLSSKNVLPQGVQVTGQVSSEGYIGEEQAVIIALTHAGLDSSQAQDIDCEMDLDDGRMIYEVEFVNGAYEYEYKLDAISGEVAEWELEWKSSNHRQHL